MTGAVRWLLRLVGAVAVVALAVAVGETTMAVRAGAWLAVPDLAALELTVVAALSVAAASLLASGRRAFQLETWTGPVGWRGWSERLALVWCMSAAATLGALPGLALGLGPPALWPLALVTLAMLAARVVRVESPRRVAWLMCVSYGLAASSSLLIVRHVF